MKKPTRKTIPISQLLVNSSNPRFEPVKNQQEAIELMLKENGIKIKRLAEDIVKNGINPSKNLIVIESQKDKFLTLEGNRRMISIKLLNDPTKTKNLDFREFFNTLHDEYSKDIPTSVSCVVFENENDARHWILLEHTGESQGKGVVRWDTEQKDRFLQTGTKLLSIYEFADENGIDREDVDSTSLKRLISTQHVCDVIGISFYKSQLNQLKPKSEIIKNLKKVFSKMSEDKFKVRDIYTKEQREIWIDDVIEIESDTTSSQSTTKSKTNTTSTSKSSKSKKSTDRKKLIPKNCELSITPSKIKNIFLELRDDLVLDGRKGTPNAIGVLFRVFLEISINHYLSMKGINPSYNIKLKEKINKVTEHMFKNNIATQTQLKYIRKTATSDNTNILSIENFHDFVHSGNIRPEPGDLKAKWDNSQEFFEILWKNV